MRMIKLLSAKR